MPTKPIDRLMFVQGGLCFFCKQPLPKSEASVEHLHASANGGPNADGNCVVCCKAVNALLGSMSLKEKFQVVLNQKGQFKCPNGAGSTAVDEPVKDPPTLKVVANPGDEKFSLVVANLKRRGNARPRTLKTLTSTVAAIVPKGTSDAEYKALVQRLLSTGKVRVADDKVTYSL